MARNRGMRGAGVKAKKIKRQYYCYSSWSNLPEHIIWLIMNRLCYADQIRFQAVCKNWRDTNIHGVRCADKLPWILAFNSYSCFLYDPSDKQRYSISNPSFRRFYGSHVLESKYGWALFQGPIITVSSRYRPELTRTSISLFFYCPFTDEIIRTPYLEIMSDIDPFTLTTASTFSTNPVSSDCVILVVRMHICDYSVSLCRLEKKTWTTFWFMDPRNSYNSLIDDIEYLDGVFYCCFSSRAIGTFDVAQEKWEIHPHPLNTLYHHRIRRNFLVEFNGELQLFMVGPHSCVFKLDRSKMNWFQVDNLSNRSLFIEDEDSESNVSIISDPMEGEELSHLANTIFRFDYSCYFDCLCLFGNPYVRHFKLPKIYDSPWKDKRMQKIWIQPPKRR